jgi:SOS response regulatory protein OraA/RecX
VPDEVVARCGLARGVELDRPLLRLLGRELRRREALTTAARALARRDLSSARLEERLRRAGVSPPAQREAVDSLARAGLLNDTRTASARAQALSERGWGDHAIEERLESEGFREAEREAALAGLDPEPERAARLAAGAADLQRAWRRLVARGFAPDSIESALGPLDGGP